MSDYEATEFTSELGTAPRIGLPAQPLLWHAFQIVVNDKAGVQFSSKERRRDR